MGASPSAWQNAVGVCLTLILVVGTWDFVSGHGTDYAGEDVQNTESSRLTRLKLLAEELKSQINKQRIYESSHKNDNIVVNRASLLAVLKSLRPRAENQVPAEAPKVKDEFLEKRRYDNHGSRQLYSDIVIINRLYRSTSLMSRFRSRYNSVYDHLSVFVPELQMKFITGAPAGLSNVDILLTLLPKDDPAFDNDQVANFISRASMVAQIAEDVLKRISPFVESDSQDWLASEASAINDKLALLYLAIFDIAVDQSIETPEVVPAGMGGVNAGVSDLTGLGNLKKIQDLYTALGQGNG